MKNIIFLTAVALFLIGCEKENEIDTTPPPPPQGIKTISLDNAIEIRWLPSQANDVKGYNVWVNNSYNGRYQLIGTTSSTNYIDYGAINGTTYYYALSAFDYSDNESELTKDVVYDTPRPEGYSVIVYDTTSSPSFSGYSFAKYRVLSWNDISTDFFLIKFKGYLYINVFSDTDIQDMGYTNSLDEISASPTDGWTPSKSVEAITGHTYVIWTVDDNYAKIRVREVGFDKIKFDWAYQTAKGNIELRISNKTRKNRTMK